MTTTTKFVALFALGLVLVTVVGCGGKEAAPAPGTSAGEQPAGGESAPADVNQEVDTQLADPDDVEIGEIV